jgi:Domain of unknown function (DUF1814).
VSRSGIRNLLSAFAAVAKRQKRRWYLFGAQAVAIWGGPRMTADVDVTVEGDPEDPALVGALLAAGFESRAGRINDFVRKTRVAPLVHIESRILLDVVFAGPGLEEEFLQRVIRVRIGRSMLPVISPEDLVITKILAGRPKDIDDVRGVLNERAEKLDLERIRGTLSRVEQALSRADLVPVFEAELVRIGTRRRPPS